MKIVDSFHVEKLRIDTPKVEATSQIISSPIHSSYSPFNFTLPHFNTGSICGAPLLKHKPNGRCLTLLVVYIKTAFPKYNTEVFGLQCM